MSYFEDLQRQQQFVTVTGPNGTTYTGTPENANYWLQTAQGAYSQQQNLSANADAARKKFLELAQNEPTPGTPAYADWKSKRDAAEAEYQRAAENARGTNPDGSPKRPEYTTITNPDGTLQKPFQISDWQNVNADRGALDLLRQDSLRQAGQLSPFAKLQLQKQQQDESNAIDQANQAGQNAGLMAQINLARSGGLSGAARERAAKQGAFQAMMAAQQARNQGAQTRTGINLQDEQMRTQGLKDLQGMENTQAQAQYQNQLQSQGVQKTNVQNQLNELMQKRAYDSNAYGQSMAAFGANRTADAQAQAARSQGGK